MLADIFRGHVAPTMRKHVCVAILVYGNASYHFASLETGMVLAKALVHDTRSCMLGACRLPLTKGTSLLVLKQIASWLLACEASSFGSTMCEVERDRPAHGITVNHLRMSLAIPRVVRSRGSSQARATNTA